MKVEEILEYCDSLTEHIGYLFENGVLTENQIYENSCRMFESTNELNWTLSFIENQKHHFAQPKIGQFYYPVSILSYGNWKKIEIIYTASDVEFITKNGSDYMLKIGNKLHKFPDCINKHTAIGDAIFFTSKNEAENFVSLTILTLVFPNWKISRYILDTYGNKTQIN